MKQLKCTIIALSLSVIAWAQQPYTQSLSGIDWIKIETKAKIVLKTNNDNQISIVPKSFKPVPEKAKGLKLVGNNGTDNTGVGFSVVKEGKTLIVRNLLNANNGDAEISIPSDKNLSITNSGWSDIEISDFSGEIEANAPVTGAITLKNVTGPITANANTGKVHVIFANVSQQSPISISTTTGEIDVTIPSNTPANLNLNSTMGEIYSNFDLTAPDKDGLRTVSANKIERSLNNGGVVIKLRSSTGNIYLRKQ